MDEETQGLIRALARKLDAESCSLTFREVWDRYFVAASPGLKKPKNVADLMKAPLAFLGDVPISEFKRASWIEYRADRTQQITRFGEPTSATTRNLELQRAKRVFNWAIEEGLIETSPLASVKREPARPARETTIAHDGVAAFLREAEPLDRALFLLGVDNGLRRIEGRALQWSKISADGRTQVSWTVAKTKKTRPAILSSRVMAALAELPRVPGSDYVFANPHTGRPYSDNHLWCRFRAIADRVGLPAAEGDGNVHFHDSRHTFVTRTIENGTPPAVAMRAAGHTTLQQASRYFHLTDGALEAMRVRNEAALSAAVAGPRLPPARMITRRVRIDRGSSITRCTENQ